MYQYVQISHFGFVETQGEQESTWGVQRRFRAPLCATRGQGVLHTRLEGQGVLLTRSILVQSILLFRHPSDEISEVGGC